MEKIIQIIPAIGIYAVYKNKKNIEYKEKVDLIALDEEGSICFLQSDSVGFFDNPTEADNFLKIEREYVE